MYGLRITARADGACSFELIEGGRELAASRAYPTDERCLDALRELIRSLRDEDDAPAGIDVPEPQTLRSLRAWASSRARFPVEWRRAGARASASQVRSVSVERYALDQAEQPGLPGIERLHREADGLHSAILRDAGGLVVLLTPGFTRPSRRDENLRVVLDAAGTRARYRRRRGGGERWCFILRGRNNREIARSRWFDDAAALEGAIRWLLRAAAELRAQLTPRRATRRESAGYPIELLEAVGAPGVERLERPPRYLVRLNDESGRGLVISHAYRSAAARARGQRALLRAIILDVGVRRQQAGARAWVVIYARNHRPLARSRDFSSQGELERALAGLRQLLVSAVGPEVVRPRRPRTSSKRHPPTSTQPTRALEVPFAADARDEDPPAGREGSEPAREERDDESAVASEPNARDAVSRAVQPSPPRRAPVVKSTDSSSLVEVVDRVLDRGIVIDAWSRVSLVGVQLVSIEARVVIASAETYLKYAAAIGLTASARPT